MALRDIILTLMVFGSLPLIFWRPYIGILVWSWLSYMNPHRQTWGFAYEMPFAQIVALTLIAAMLLSKEKYRLQFNPTIVIWTIFLVWMLFTTAFALYPENAFIQLVKVYKIQLVTFLTLILITDKKKLDYLIWVIVVSIGFYSVKGGLFTLVTGGVSRVYGPPDSYIEENNALAVAGLMVIPLFFYLQHLHKDKLMLRLALLAGMAFAVVAIFGSQSRGALIAVAAVGGFFWLKSRLKIISGALILVLGLFAFNFMPESWHERMDSIRNYQEDSSAMGRLNAWEYSYNVANDRITGAGFQSWQKGSFQIWAPNPSMVHAAHSIYFSMLADHGWPGLFVFLLILFLTWRRLSRIIKQTRDNQLLESENILARMLQVSLIAYGSGGAFLSLAYFDLPWHIIAIAIILEQHVKSVSQPEDNLTRVRYSYFARA